MMRNQKELLSNIESLEVFNPRKENFYEMPTKAVFGHGAIRKINEILNLSKFSKIFLISGEHFKSTDDSKFLLDQLKSKNEVFINEKKISKSDFETINQLADFSRQIKPDLLIAIGGGTILDTGKCIATLINNNGKVEDYVKSKSRKLENPSVALIAIPTTAGTGSELSPWATVWDEEEKKKYSLASSMMFPTLAIIDPSLTDSLPPKITAETGIDALAQAIESYWSVKHNPISDKFALQAIKLAIEFLPKAVNFPSQEARNKMAKASLLDALAFSNTQTTICHSVSYPITAHFNISHGQAVAVTLPSFLKETVPVLEIKRKKALLQALNVENEDEARKKMISLLKEIGLATKLSQLGIKKNDLSLIIKEGFHPDRAKNAPKIPNTEELQKILENIL
jgi:phosphonate metabolism-associated iron-containing alcohol dehydrogenase